MSCKSSEGLPRKRSIVQDPGYPEPVQGAAQGSISFISSGGARANLELVTQVCEVSTVQEVRLNPFRSGLAQRSPRVMWGELAGDRGPVIADNNYVAVVRKRGGKY